MPHSTNHLLPLARTPTAVLRLNRPHAAATHFGKSLQLAEIKSERMFLTQRLHICEQSAAEGKR
jgi:predicted RNA polymerase sigma factor